MKPLWRLRIGLLCLGLAGLVFAVGDMALNEQANLMAPMENPDAFVEEVSQPGFAFWSARGLVGITLEVIGAISLYLYLQHYRRVEGLAYWGMMTSIVGDGLSFVLFGLMTFMVPQVASLYAETGNLDILSMANLMEGPAATAFMIGMIVGLIGLILNAIAIWRSRVLPKFSGLVILIGFLMLFSQNMVVQVLSNVVVAIGGFWIAFGAWNKMEVPEQT